VSIKPLYEQPGFSDVVRLERWRPGTAPGPVSYASGAELFVLQGDLHDEAGSYTEGCWMRLPAGATHQLRTLGGCTLYIKRGGLGYLKSA
jgi:hypothetical protein